MNLGFGQLFILLCLAGLLFADLPAVVKRVKATIQTIKNERTENIDETKSKKEDN